MIRNGQERKDNKDLWKHKRHQKYLCILGCLTSYGKGVWSLSGVQVIEGKDEQMPVNDDRTAFAEGTLQCL